MRDTKMQQLAVSFVQATNGNVWIDPKMPFS
jgi:hypothetical protein